MQKRRVSRRQRRVPGGSTQRINIRTTPEIWLALFARAETARLSLPRYLVESGLRTGSTGWSLREQRWWAERLDVVDVRLARVGTNINQMAARLHATGVRHEGLDAALVYLHGTQQLLRHVLAAIEAPAAADPPGA